MSSYTLGVSEVGQLLTNTASCPRVVGTLKLYLEVAITPSPGPPGQTSGGNLPDT